MRKRRIYRKTVWETLGGFVLPILFTLVVVGLILFGLRQAEETSRAEGLRILEESINRAVVQNYASEGKYPESLSYIEEKYGISIDHSKYVVHYSVFASNILPDVMVIELR